MDYKKGLLLVLLTSVVSGFSIFINSFGVKNFDSSVFTFAKNTVVAVLLFAIIVGLGNFSNFKKLNKTQWLKLMSIGFIGGSIPFLLFFKGLQMTTAATSSFIHKTLFIYAGIFAILFLKEKLTKGLLIGMGLLLLGNYFLIRPDFIFSLGDILILVATLFWAAENTLSKHLLKEVSGNIVAFGRMFFGSFFILLFLLFSGKSPIIFSMSYQQYMWIIITSALLLLYVFSYYNGLKYVKVSTATSVLVLGSVITTALDFLFKGSPVTFGQSVGMLFIILGVISIVWFANIAVYFTNLFGAKKYERS